MRVIADHARATAFLDRRRHLPGQRRAQLRAAQDHAPRDLAREPARLQGPLLQQGDELRRRPDGRTPTRSCDESRAVIERVVKIEEKLYASTVGAGLNMLDEVHAEGTGGKVVPGADVFRLYDTYGLRDDLIEYVAEQRGFAVDDEGFEAETGEAAPARARELEGRRGTTGRAPSTSRSLERGRSRVHRLRRDRARRGARHGARQRRRAGRRTRGGRRGRGRARPHAVLRRVGRAGRRHGRDRDRGGEARWSRHGRAGLGRHRPPGARSSRGGCASGDAVVARVDAERRGADAWPITRRRTCCTPRCARSSGRTSSRPGRSSRPTGCASTSRTSPR